MTAGFHFDISIPKQQIIVYLCKMTIQMVRHFMQPDILYMTVNKKYRNLMLQKCKPYYELDDYKIIIFKMGRRKILLFYVPLYGSGQK